MSATVRPIDASDSSSCVAGLLERPAAVDEGQPLLGLDRVDVDRPQAVHRQRQRDPVDAVGDGMGAGLGPVRCVGHPGSLSVRRCTAEAGNRDRATMSGC